MADSIRADTMNAVRVDFFSHAARETAADRYGTQPEAASLLNQQLWCWGRDIEASSGNLLVAHGFQRIAKPKGVSAASIYRLDLTPSSRVILRGFGVFFGDDRWGGVFLPRFEFTPQFSAEPDLSRPAWSSDDLPSLRRPRKGQMPWCQRLMLDLIDWIRRYEIWIAAHQGVTYRHETLVDWKAKHESVVPAEEIAVAWRLLGLAISLHPERLIRCSKSRSARHA